MTEPPDDQSAEERLRRQVEAIVEERLRRQIEASTKQIVPYEAPVPAQAEPPQRSLDVRLVRLEERERAGNATGRIEHLERELTAMKTKATQLDTKVGQLASREDFEKAKNSILRWLVGTGVVAAGVLVALLAIFLP